MGVTGRRCAPCRNLGQRMEGVEGARPKGCGGRQRPRRLVRNPRITGPETQLLNIDVARLLRNRRRGVAITCVYVCVHACPDQTFFTI